jgi:hypothetical protein
MPEQKSITSLCWPYLRYQVHHCDMALDLAVTLVYLEDVRMPGQAELHEHSRDAFNLICYLAFLAHAFNADRTIRLSDWYKEIGWRSFKNCRQLNGSSGPNKRCKFCRFTMFGPNGALRVPTRPDRWGGTQPYPLLLSPKQPIYILVFRLDQELVTKWFYNWSTGLIVGAVCTIFRALPV